MKWGERITKEEYDREKHGAIWWIGRVILLILVIGTFSILLWRLLSSGDPADISTMTPNDTLYEVWKQAKAEGQEPSVFWNEQDTITRNQESYGYFSVTKALFIEQANQVQLIFRYNNSTIKHLVQDYGLETMPDRTEDLYDVTLYVAYDLTPADSSDNDGNDPESVKFVRYFPTSSTAEVKNLYNYRRFVFDGVDINVTETPVLAVYVDIYYTGDIEYHDTPYGALLIYDYASERIPYEWTDRDREAMEAWGTKDE